MKQHWALVIDIKKEFAYIKEYPVGRPRLDWLDWEKGCRQDVKADGIITTTSDEYPPLLTGGVPNIFSLPIFSKRLVEELKEIGVNNLELQPISIKNHETGEVVNDYFICNVIGLISCLDREHADCRWDRKDPQVVKAIRTLVISEGMIEKHNNGLVKEKVLKMFRLQEYPYVLIVDDDVKRLFEDLNIQGWKCIKPEDWI